ncbi:MAG: PLDc N-terminal domain-containing protein [Acidimicrobiia bacterium]
MGTLDDAMRALLAIGLVVPLAFLWIVAFVDVARRKDLPVLQKALWAGVMFFGAYIGIAVYFAMRPIPLPPGKDANATTPPSSAIVTELEALQSRYATGELSNDNYLSRKRSLFGLT